jgi:hypothetical protein
VPGDFGFLDGWFDVVNRRLRDPADPTSGWAEFPATARAMVLFDGAVSLDEMWFPEQRRYGMSLRLYEPATGQWAVYWVDGRRGRVEPPVRGRWGSSGCRFTGPDNHAGRPIDVSYAWADLRNDAAQWEQCFSFDEGRTWQPNWQMTWTRRDEPAEHGCDALRVTSDFDFLAGAWRVEHRRDARPLAERPDWHQFAGDQRGWIFLAGSVSVDELELADPGQHGLTFRSYDPQARRWSIYWVNSKVGRLETPVSGTFGGGVGSFEAVETIDGRDVHVHFVWDEITESSARWRQSFSFDAGISWRENWQMRLERIGAST